jgi:hypothetical protein
VVQIRASITTVSFDTMEADDDDAAMALDPSLAVDAPDLWSDTASSAEDHHNDDPPLDDDDEQLIFAPPDAPAQTAPKRKATPPQYDWS